ncbi:pseudaminic acid cytidylyltransferase [Chitinophaga oryzae]|uniref:Pseudaminic acid cytidylyltransferase n=1 Tax=Chitinophaga oryzae TaxID=2725414 RepID=A0AAE6ZMJ5_9BACT|nr:pseudaminic acid cytidylyltransferase [Chitinophaga oryzae]QJB34115.1 pseudaminic acid cytidylyltransferase [Chitinophaga oryzae]QJB40634.1 pseudaminic acid cytidylyltransferase [Chitinophaga oryzae]
MKNVALIPARGGSKRIPGKNTKDFLGKPIIHYSIHAAIESGLFDEVMVSTDDEKTAEIAMAAGAKVPFLRSAKASDDYATIADVIKEVLDSYKEKQNLEFDNLCCIFATAPFTTPEKLRLAYELMNEKNYISVFPASRFSYPIMRALNVDSATNKVSMVWPEYMQTRSQDIPDAYHDCGQFYWVKVAGFMKHNALFTPNSGIIELNFTEFQDIDTEEDWKLAELKYELNK